MSPSPIRSWLRKLLRPLLIALGVVIVLFEELAWDILSHLMARLARLPILARIEAQIRRLPPYGAMALFLLPILVILPFKLLAVWLMAQGHVIGGIAVLLAAKFSGMAAWARIYALCHPALSTLGWFVKLEATLHRWRDWAHEKIEHIPGLQKARSLARSLSARVKSWLGEVGA